MSDRTPAGAESVSITCTRCGVEIHPIWGTCRCNPDAVWGKCFECDREIDLTVSNANGWEINGHALCEACCEWMQEE